MGDLEYRAAWKYVLLPILKEFDPDLVLIAAGFDAAASDIGDCCVTPEGYAALTRQILDALQSLRPSSTAPVIGALEGGYQPRVLGQCVVAVIQELLQSTLKNKKDGGRQSSLNVSAENCSSDDDLDLWKVIQTSAARDIRQTVQALRPHWACLHKNDS
jgi:histone deacetylase 6